MEEKYSLTCPDGPAIAPVLWAMFLTTQVMAASWPSATTSGVVRLSIKLGTEKKTFMTTTTEHISFLVKIQMHMRLNLTNGTLPWSMVMRSWGLEGLSTIKPPQGPHVFGKVPFVNGRTNRKHLHGVGLGSISSYLALRVHMHTCPAIRIAKIGKGFTFCPKWVPC